MRIVVLVKQVPDTYEERRLDPVSARLDRGANEAVIDEIDERALEVALSHKDANPGTEVVALSMGPREANAALRKALSLGADAAVHVLDDALAGADLALTSLVIAAALRKNGYDLVIGGNESTDGRGGVIPAMIAEHLALPHLTSLDSVEIVQDTVSGVRGTDRGSMSAHATLPAVISITERLAEARFPSFKGIMSAKKKPLTVITVGDLDLDPAEIPGRSHRSIVLSATERAQRTAGARIVDDGTAGTQLAAFLAAGHLI